MDKYNSLIKLLQIGSKNIDEYKKLCEKYNVSF